MDLATATPIITQGTAATVTTILGVVILAGKIIDSKATIKAANGNGKQHVMACPGPPVGTGTRDGLSKMNDRLAEVVTDVAVTKTEVKYIRRDIAAIFGLLGKKKKSGDPGSDENVTGA